MSPLNRPGSSVTLARAHVSRHLSRSLPYYLTPDEARALIDAAENDRDRLFLRLLWETGVRVSEAVRITLGDVGRDGIRVFGKGSVETSTPWWSMNRLSRCRTPGLPSSTGVHWRRSSGS